MNDTQILTLALTLLGIFAASWFNNSRIGDVNSRIGDLNLRIADMRDVLRAELKAELGNILHRIERMDENIARVLADHEGRINKLEARK